MVVQAQSDLLCEEWAEWFHVFVRWEFREGERLHALQALLWEQQTAFNVAMAGRTMDVLFEKKGRQPGQAIGRSPWLQSVHVDDADDLIGRIVRVEIEHGQQNSLKGRLVEFGQPSAATPHSAGAVPQERLHGA